MPDRSGRPALLRTYAERVCGRIALSDDPGRLARILEASLELDEEWEPHWNVGPTAPILGVSEDREGHRHLAEYRWGLVPPSAKDPSSVRNTFNARAETVATKPIFRAAFQRWRILVPVDLFYEWTPEKPKQPYAFKRADGDPLVLAGLRGYWRGPDGTELRSATIVTTTAGPDMPIHDRQPVVLERDSWEHWLDRSVTDRDELEPLLHPGASGTLVHFPVSRAVGDVRNDSPDLVEELVT